MDGDNPYQSPHSHVAEPMADDVAWTLATKWRRFFHWMIDRVMVLGLIFGALLAAGVIGGDAVLDWAERLAWWHEQLIGYVAIILYYTLMEGITGTTIGKLVTGTRVVDEAGRRVRFGQALLRSVSRVVPFEAFSVLLADDDDPRGWHDRWPRTRVVRRRATAIP